MDGGGTGGIERARAASPPETAALTHGGYARGPLHCDACAIAEHCDRRSPGGTCGRDEDFTARQRPLLAQAVRDSGHDLKLHGALIERAVTAGLIIERMQRYLAVFGDLDPEQLARGVVKQQPGTDLLLKAIAGERQALEALDLTPHAIAKLDAAQGAGDGGNMAAAILAVAQQRDTAALGEGEPVDAEYEEDAQHEQPTAGSSIP